MLSRSRPRAWAVEPIPFRDMAEYVRSLWPGDPVEFFDVITQLDEHYMKKIAK